MADNKISTSKKEIYTKLLDIAEKYTDIKNTDFLKTGLFGYITESMAMMIRDSSFHKSMLYNEGFLNTAVLPQSVYNWAKMFNIEVQKAIPKYATVNIIIPSGSIDGFLRRNAITTKDQERYGLPSDVSDYLILNKEDPIIAGDFYYSLEHSILLRKLNDLYVAEYIISEYESTNFEKLNKPQLIVVNDSDNITIKARVYQYKTTVLNRQITSTSFLNKVQLFEFTDQFCGAKLFYEENNKYEEVNLAYSNMNTDSKKKTAFYNLLDENELEISFKVGDNYFMPSANTKLKVLIYTTSALNAPSQFNGNAIMLFSNNDLKSLPLIIQFNPTSLLGGKNRPSMGDIKKNIINEISTRNTITTKSDLDRYFSILTSLIADVNDGKVTFIKKRDDIIKRMYNAYLLLRDNVDDSEEEASTNVNVLSRTVPTNTMNVLMNRKNMSNSLTSYNYRYPIFNESGHALTEVPTDETTPYYICPFNIFVTTTPINFVKYIYNMTDCNSTISYRSDSFTNKATNYYIIPENVHLFRGFTDSGYEADKYYYLTLETTTNKPIGKDKSENKSALSYNGSVSVKGLTANILLTKDNNEITIYSEKLEDGLYKTTFEFVLTVDDTEFYFDGNNELNTISEREKYCNSIRLKSASTPVQLLSAKERLAFDFSNLIIDGEAADIILEADSDLTFYEDLDSIMESSIIVNNASNNTNYPIGLTDVPLLHSSYLKGANAALRKENFVGQLFTYIQILKDNLDRLESSTFFNLKFYNTYGLSRYYYTSRTNINLSFEIVLSNKSYNTTNIKNEIKAYIRKLVDRMNEKQDFTISDIISTLQKPETYGKYIHHISFIGLDDTLEQHIYRLKDVGEEEYTPEWINIDSECLNDNDNTKTGIFFSVIE